MFPFQTLKCTVYQNEHTYILSTTPMSPSSGERIYWEVNLTSVAVNQDIESRKHPLKGPNINIVAQN